MPTITWGVICQSVSFDRFDRLCVTGITLQLPVEKLPFAFPEFVIVARVVAAEGEHIVFGLEVRRPSGRPRPVPMSSDVAVSRFQHGYWLITLRGFPFEEEGVYQFDLLIDGNIAATIEFPVMVFPSSAPPTTFLH